jgi:hypothetical protein
MMKKSFLIACLFALFGGGFGAFAQKALQGQNLVTSRGGTMVFRGASEFGDSYWISERPILTGNAQEQWETCKALEARERAALNHPEGYAYFPSSNNPGHVVLVPDQVPYRDGKTGDAVLSVVASSPAVPSPTSGGGDVQAQIAAKEAQIRQLETEIAQLRGQAPVSSSVGGQVSGPPEVSAPISAVAPVNPIGNAAVLAVKIGSSFHNGDGVWMEARPKSAQGNPFWSSSTGPLAGMGQEQMNALCNLLTVSEHQQGRIPVGYGYFPNIEKNGRYVLIPTSEVGFDYLSLPVALPIAGGGGLVGSPFADGLRLDVSGILRGIPVVCPKTGRQFRLP